MCQHAKFREDRSNRCGDMADFRFFKMAAVRHLGFVLRVLEPPTKTIGGLYDCAKFGCNRRSNFDSTQISIFCTLSLKMPIQAPKIRVLGDFTPKMGSSMNETPKGTSLGGNTSYDVSIVKIGPLPSAPNNKAKKIF